MRPINGPETSRPAGGQNREGGRVANLLYADHRAAYLHCMTEVHAGGSWQPYTEVDLVLKYGSERIVRIEKGVPVVGNDRGDHSNSRTPFWVDVFRDGERLVRWGQPAMLRATNPTREELNKTAEG